MEHNKNLPSTSQFANIDDVQSLIEQKEEEMARLQQEVDELNEKLDWNLFIYLFTF